VDVVVRRATESDIPQVVGFTRDTFTWGDYVPRVINKWVKDGTAYVALINEEVIGVVNLVLLPTGVAWLEGIRVKPTYRRRGVGTALTNYVLNLARVKGARYAMLMIAEWNNASHGLARKLGFKPILNELRQPCRAAGIRHDVHGLHAERVALLVPSAQLQ